MQVGHFSFGKGNFSKVSLGYSEDSSLITKEWIVNNSKPASAVLNMNMHLSAELIRLVRGTITNKTKATQLNLVGWHMKQKSYSAVWVIIT